MLCVGSKIVDIDKSKIYQTEQRKESKMAEGGNEVDISFEDCEEIFDDCSMHGNPMRFYCRESLCRRKICENCLRDHGGHNIMEIVDMVTEKQRESKLLQSHSRAVINNLHMIKAKTVASKCDITKSTTESISALKSTKHQAISLLNRYFGKMMTDVYRKKRSVEEKLDITIQDMDRILQVIDNISDDCNETEKYENLMKKKAALGYVAVYLQHHFPKTQVYYFPEYSHSPITRQRLRDFCGYIQRSNISIDTAFTVELEDDDDTADERGASEATQEVKVKATPRRRRSSKKQKKPAIEYDVLQSTRTKFSSDFAVLMSVGSVPTTCGSLKSCKRFGLVSVADDANVKETVLESSPTSIAQVTLAGKQCLALSYRAMQRIDFCDLKDPSKVFYSHSVAPYQPGALSTASPTMLLCEDQSTNPRRIRWFDCDSSRPKLLNNVTYTKENNIWDMCYVKYEGKELLLTTRGEHGLSVYNVQTDNLECNVTTSLKDEMSVYGVATDGRGTILVCDLNHDCIQMFSFDGKYKGRFPNKSRTIGHPELVRFCSDTSRLFVVHKKSRYYYISVLKLTCDDQ